MQLRYEDVFALAARIHLERTGERAMAPVLHHAVEGLIAATSTTDGAAALAERITDVRAEVIQLAEEGEGPHVSPETFAIVDAVKTAIHRLRVAAN